MQFDPELYNKFPVILRDKLTNNEIELPDGTLFDYEKILTYRAVQRKEDDFTPVTETDFRSYFELNKKPKSPRGVKKDFSKDPHYYGVSSFLKKEIVEQKMKFPNPRKKIARGYVYKEAGPQETKEDHVCWWLYDKVKIEGYSLIEEWWYG